MRIFTQVSSWRVCVLAMLTLILVVSGCSPEIPQRSSALSGERVQAVFDPTTSTIPLPNDLALDPEGTLPSLIPQGAAVDSAQLEFLSWLSDLHGWLPEMEIEVPFSGKLDQATVNKESVLLFRVTEEGLESLELGSIDYVENDDGTSKVYAYPKERPEAGARLSVLVTKAIVGANGLPIGEPLPIFFAASPSPLVDENNRPTLAALESDPDTAVLLEGIRQFLSPVYVGAQELGIDRNDVAMAFVWTVTPDPMTVLDPETATIPTPNTLALDEDGTFPAAALCHVESDTAQGHFEQYLAGLHGWPTTTPITLPLSGAVDPATVTQESVQFWRISESGEAEQLDNFTLTVHEERIDRCNPEVRQEGYSIELTPLDELDYKATYFAFATRDIASPDELSLKPPAAVYLALQPHPVVNADGESLVENVTDAQAQAIAGVQRVLRPIVEKIEAETELTYRDLSSVWTWFTWTDSFAVFDPTAGSIPFPNAFLMEDGTVNLPIPANADPLTAAMFAELNTRRGFSVTSPGWIPVQGELQEDTISTESVIKAYVEGIPKLLTEDDYSVHYQKEYNQIVVNPTTPLRAETQHVGIVTTDVLGANGRPIQPTPAFVFLRSPHPLVDGDGKSLVDVLDDATASALEPAREAYGVLFTGAQFVLSLQREKISLAWAYDTGETTRVLQEYRALAHHVLSTRQGPLATRYCERLVDGCDEEDPYFVSEAPEDLLHPTSEDHYVRLANVQAIQWAGEFETTKFIYGSSNSLATAQNLNQVSSERVGISLFVPRVEQTNGQRCEPPFDVAIVQHGLTHHRMSMGLSMADALAAYPHCYATVAMDLPLHGGRASGASSLHTFDLPEASGQGFVSANLVATKSYFIQSVIDLFVLTKVIRGVGGLSGLEALVDKDDDQTVLFSGDVAYVGVSLGGMLGALFATVEPNLQASVLSNAGGMITKIIEGDDGQGSVFGKPIIEPLAAMGIVPGTNDYTQTMTFLQWAADIIDPITFAPHIRSGGLDVLVYDAGTLGFRTCEGAECPQDTEQTSGTEVLLQMAQDDAVIVNSTTQLLAEAIDVSLEHTTFTEAPHGFMAISHPTHPAFWHGYCARAQSAQWLSSSREGVPNLPASLNAMTCVEALR